MRDNIFCDSNILLYAFGKQDLKKKAIASKLILDKKSIISVQVINEVSNIMLRKLNFTNEQIQFFIQSCYRKYNVSKLGKKIFLLACDIRNSYKLSYYDSIIVATAMESNCKIIYSEDMQHKQIIFDKLTIIDPFKEL